MELTDVIYPNSIEAEQATLGSMMIDEKCIGKAMEIVSSGDFYRPAHAEVFDSIVAIYLRGEPVDLITLNDELTARGKIDYIGGVEYLMVLNEQVPSASRVEHYAKIVREKSILRWLQRAGSEIADLASSGLTAEEAHERANQIILNGPRHASNTGFLTVEQSLSRAFEAFKEAEKNKGKIIGPKSGLSLDHITRGFPQGLTLIAARPSKGKTSLLLRIMEHSEEPLALFSLESPVRELMARMLTQKTGIDSYALYGGSLSEAQKRRLKEAAKMLRTHRSVLCEDSLSAAELFGMAQRAVLQYGVKGILIDYVQLIDPGTKSEGRNNDIDAISRALQKIGQRLKIPVIAASQLSRRCEQREDKRPMLSDLRDSGGLEQNADVVIFIHHTENERQGDDDVVQREVEFIIAKNRNGKTGAVKLWWRPDTLTFFDKAGVDE